MLTSSANSSAIPADYDSEDDDTTPFCESTKIDIEPAQLPRNFNTQQIRVSVSEVNNPAKFWFHIMSVAPHPLNELMDRIRQTYGNLTSNERRLVTDNLEPGQICAARYEGIWHRGRIVQYTQFDHKAMVHFVDFGTTASVPVDELKFLQRIYAKLPCQAYRGCLDYVRPTEQRWCRDATYAFMGMTQNMVLDAKLTSISRKDGVIRMMLINTKPYGDMHINAELIQRGFAKPCWTPTLISSAGRIYRHISECIPTFEELETAKFPSFKDVGRQLATIYGVELSLDHT